MHTRLFSGHIQQGKADEAWQVLNEFARRVKEQKGCILNQVLQAGNEVVGISTWETQQDLAAMPIAIWPASFSNASARCSWECRRRGRTRSDSTCVTPPRSSRPEEVVHVPANQNLG